MKKVLVLALSLMLLAAMSVTAFAQDDGVVKVSAVAEVYTYHQIKAFVIEYDREVAQPEEGTYHIVDFAPSHMKEDYDQRPFAEAVITAVYTNDAPEMREDRTSVPGKYVVIEQELVDGFFYDEEAGIYKPNNLCGLCTWRLLGESSEWFRNDFSELVISQQKNIVDAEGNVVAKPQALPTLQMADVRTLLVEDFEITSIPSRNGKYDIHYSIALPKDYDASRKYPVVVTCHGAGGSLNYNQRDAEGNLLCVGGDLGRDAVPVAWLREVDEDVIVVSPQRWASAPQEWEVDAVDDLVLLLETLEGQYSIDTDRIYGIGSSAGSMHLSQVIETYPDLFAGYMQCNSQFRGINIYNKEFRTSGKDMLTTSTYALSLPVREENVILPMDSEEWADARAKLQGVVENRLPIYIWHGVNDTTFSWTAATSVYYVLREMYHEEGLTEAEIDELVKLYLADDPEYHDVGICEIHATSKLAVWNPWVMEWLLDQ